ncbi:MAG: PHP domain-containing protein [Treponema sp.]|jgi:hypothetical protein|nr:PHP domain-containing protein [Treponema sp.]
MSFLYETHLHTCQGSACGVSRGRDYIKKYKDLGFTGIMVTDHFFNSNTAANRSLPWKNWVDAYCSGFEDAREQGEKSGLDVFFGWEETFDGDDYLVYGLDKAWLLEHPELVRWTRAEQFREVHKYGGCIVQAHPFRQHSYIRELHLAPFLVDSIETANAGNHDDSYDRLAAEYARVLGLPAVAGSDIHNADDLLFSEPYGVELSEKLSSINDYAALILGKADIGLHIPKHRCDYRKKDGARPLDRKVDIRTREDKSADKARIMNFDDIRSYVENIEAEKVETLASSRRGAK